VKKLLGIVLVLALVLSFSFVMATPVVAAITTVGPGGAPTYDYATIQEAIDAASPGEIIEVAAGTYQERITIHAHLVGLQLRGAQYGVDARDRTGADESIIGGDWAVVPETGGIWIRADDVVIDGFTIEPHVDFWGMIRPSGAGITISNNIIRRTIGVFRTERLTVERNWFVDPRAGTREQGRGFYCEGATDLTIIDNRFTDMGYAAIVLGSPHDYINTTITGNEIYQTQSYAITVAGSSQTNLKIENNIIEHAGLQYPQSEYWKGRGAIHLHPVPHDNLSIQGNRLLYSVSGITFILYTPTVADWTDVTIENNFIGYNYYGIYMTDYAGAVPGGISAHNNAISCNVWGAFTYGKPFDATNNWWGSNDGPGGAGPGSGDPVRASVIYDPWLVLTLTADPPSVSPGGSSVITADVTTNSDGDDTGASIPDGTPILFATSSSSVDPELAFAADGVATTTYTAGTVPGTVSATSPCYPDNIEVLDVPLAPLSGPRDYVVGWEGSPVNKLTVMAPWIALVATMMAGVSLLMLRRRRAQM